MLPPLRWRVARTRWRRVHAPKRGHPHADMRRGKTPRRRMRVWHGQARPAVTASQRVTTAPSVLRGARGATAAAAAASIPQQGPCERYTQRSNPGCLRAADATAQVIHSISPAATSAAARRALVRSPGAMIRLREITPAAARAAQLRALQWDHAIAEKGGVALLA
jgi:hypothetical protein